MDPRQRSVTSFFSSVSRLYDFPPLQAWVYRPTQDAVVNVLLDRLPERVLDVGCGTGQLTARIADELRPQEVVGCDASAGMLARARERSAAVTWVEGSAEELPFADDSFDAVVTTEAFHWFDQPRALADFRRVLGDDGVLVIGVMTPSSAMSAKAWSFLGAAHWPTLDQLPELIEAAGFRVVDQFKARRVFGSSLSSVVTIAEPS